MQDNGEISVFGVSISIKEYVMKYQGIMNLSTREIENGEFSKYNVHEIIECQGRMNVIIIGPVFEALPLMILD